MAAVLESQVAGHQGSITTDDSGLFLIKATSQREIEFYDTLAPALHSTFVGYWTPRFFGTLSLHGRVETGKGSVLKPEQLSQLQTQQGQTAIVLENLTHYFVKPCVIDFKLGKQLWDEDAPQEKRERMIKNAAGTTIASKGLRLAGCRIYDAQAGDYVATSKDYGKTIREDQLGEALRKCFPDHLPTELLLNVLRTVKSLLHGYRSEVQTIEWRLRGSSILIVYEGDPERLEAALQQESANENSTPLEGEDDSDDDSEDEVEDFQPAVLLKAVDFAHAWDFRGQGPDEGYNEGLANLMALVEARLQEVEAV